MPSAFWPNEYLVTSSKPASHAPRPMDIEGDVIAQRLHTQPVNLKVLFGFHRTQASLTRRDFYRNGNVLFDLLVRLVPFAEWQRVFVTAEDAVLGQDGEIRIFHRQKKVFDRNSTDNTTADAQQKLEFLLRVHMLGILEDDLEDSVPDREWTFVIQQVR